MPRPYNWSTSVRARDAHVKELTAAVAAHYPPLTGKGRGIVTVGGGPYWPGIVVMVRLLREIGVDLPVEAWYRGSVEEVNAADVAGLNVTLRDMTVEAAGDPTIRMLGGWQAKIYAVLNSAFETVMFLDADAYCVADPTILLDWADTAGTVFWIDLPYCAKNVRWRWSWPPGNNGVPQIQGGQFAVNRPLAAREIAVTHWINQRADYYYPAERPTKVWHMYGDQDGWRVALAATGGSYDVIDKIRQHGTVLVGDVNTGPIVVHRTGSKLFTANRPAPIVGLPYEKRVHELFKEVTRAT